MTLIHAGDAGFLGMRGMLNGAYTLTARFGADTIFPQAYPTIARETMTPSIHILWAALWSGIARNLMDRARALLLKEAAPDPADAAVLWAEFSRLAERHYTMNALVRDAARDFDAGAPRDEADPMVISRTTRLKRLKIVCGDLVEEICQGALTLIGMRAYAEAGPYSLSQPLRDALSARVMISNHRLRLGNAKVERYILEEL